MNNTVGIHYGSFITNWMDEQLSLISRVKRLGFDLLEFGSDYLLSLDDAGLQLMREEAQREGVKLVLSMGMSGEDDISSFDSNVRKTGISELQSIAAAMEKVGASDCSGIVYCPWNGPISGPEERLERWKQSVASMKEVTKAYEDHGVYLNIEVANRFENFLINDCATGLAYLDEVDSPHLGIHLDTFHMNIEEDSFLSPIVEAGSRMRYFHAGENNRKMPGLGMMPWKMIFDALKIADYRGPITMETFVHPGGEIGDAVSLYRTIMDTKDYEDDIRQSLAFIRALMK